MKALILASGEGKRLRPLTYKIPKPLLKILEDKTILDYQMENLIGCGIKDIIITTGPFEDKIKAYLEKNLGPVTILGTKNLIEKSRNTGEEYPVRDRRCC